MRWYEWLALGAVAAVLAFGAGSCVGDALADDVAPGVEDWAHEVAAAYAPYEVPGDAPRPEMLVVAGPAHMLGAFGPRHNVVLLNVRYWDPRGVASLDTLVHELIHWRQVASGWASGRRFCEIEREAYLRSRRALGRLGELPRMDAVQRAATLCYDGDDGGRYTPMPPRP